EPDCANEHREEDNAAAPGRYPRGQDELAAVLDLGSKLFDKRLEADDLVVWVDVAFVMVRRLVLDLLRAGAVMIVMPHIMPSAPAPLYVSAPRRGALSSVYLSANNRNSLLIDRSRIPCLEGGEIDFARLVSSPRPPAMSLGELSRGE